MKLNAFQLSCQQFVTSLQTSCFLIPENLSDQVGKHSVTVVWKLGFTKQIKICISYVIDMYYSKTKQECFTRFKTLGDGQVF